MKRNREERNREQEELRARGTASSERNREQEEVFLPREREEASERNTERKFLPRERTSFHTKADICVTHEEHREEVFFSTRARESTDYKKSMEGL